jgi:hypothetical protein
MSWLEGKKTYIGIIVSTVWALLGIFGVVDSGSEEFASIAAVILAFTGISVNLAIHKK